MALYHAHFSKVQRSKGQNAISSAAYVSATSLIKLDGTRADYSHKEDVCASRIMAPT